MSVEFSCAVIGLPASVPRAAQGVRVLADITSVFARVRGSPSERGRLLGFVTWKG
jgi:hypothetical protein